jgi:hypothetical protein
MAIAIFGISNNGLSLVVNLLVLMLVVVWLALIVYTYLDAKRRISDSFLVGCATVASFIPYVGTAVYAIVRPPEFLEDAHERKLETRAAELRVRQLEEDSCDGCGYPIERSYLRCPECQRRLKHPCSSCGKAVDPRWALCPHCETALPERERPRRRGADGEKPRRASAERRVPAERKAQKPAPKQQQKPPSKPQPKRSPSREPDPDPRKA